MQSSQHSPAEIVDELLALATGLGLLSFVAAPLAIPCIAVTVAFLAPVLVLMVVLGVLATPPLLATAWLRRKKRARARTRAREHHSGAVAVRPAPPGRSYPLARKYQPTKKEMQMPRIEGVPRKKASPMTKLIYRFGPRMTKKLTGREPQTGTGIEPFTIWAYSPKMLMAMGKFNGSMRKGKTVSQRIQNLIELKGNAMIGCEFCVDLGSQICRNSGFSDEELLALPNYRSSKLFSDEEKAALDFTVGFMRTPVDISDEVFANAQKYFSNQQLVEICGLLTVVNLVRVNAAFKIGSAGFSEGMVCVPPERPADLHDLRAIAG
jgi:alkylhydroperoxidase family enzyme